MNKQHELMSLVILAIYFIMALWERPIARLIMLGLSVILTARMLRILIQLNRLSVAQRELIQEHRSQKVKIVELRDRYQELYSNYTQAIRAHRLYTEEQRQVIAKLQEHICQLTSSQSHAEHRREEQQYYQTLIEHKKDS